MDMQTAINELIEDIKADYLNYTLRGATARRRDAEAKGSTRYFDDDGLTQINRDMIAKFNEGITFKAGKKYIKIITDRSVWGFIVNVDNDKKFPKGTILKAAGYNAPARNHSRGNILEGGYTIRWTGPLYM